MKTPTSPAALRVARTLTELSLSEVAEIVRIPRRAIAATEAGVSVFNDHNVRLIEFYESKGIEFLGELTMGKEVARAGARWRVPADRDTVDIGEYHAVHGGVSFQAARALLGLKQTQTAERTGLKSSAIGRVEAGEPWPSIIDKLRKFYIKSGVEFLGWCDAHTQLYYGVGARWGV